MRQIMRHKAWQRQQRAIADCLNAQARTKYTVTAGLFTAASLLGVPVPNERLHRGIYTIVKNRAKRIRLINVSCHSWNNADSLGSTIDVHGLLCLSPEALFAQMSSWLTLRELVVFGDSLTCRDRLLKRTSIRDIQVFLAECDPFKGLDKCRRALTLMKENTDSPAETNLRLLIRSFGFPDLSVNIPVSVEQHTFLIDMGCPEYKIGIEFNGRHHRQQSAEDWERLNAIHSTRWRIFTVETDSIQTGTQIRSFVDCLQRALVKAGALGFKRFMEPLSVKEMCDRRRRLPQ
ncbi:hypothetical protein CRD60_05010 [Bifidobacterium aemilianum]|uniref:DUF559 domain-containing protein n=1 Tax=Bifidobacterium aemilianum TaxID=2493120 RepID=A0A366K8D7_9BIFI|nr:DUF559 domain-containing protein [Bifidobacterium aemilianum]RBP97934.1 hypothetical protein CRD60_05010 [Bifidobacterium aemilianum]